MKRKKISNIIWVYDTLIPLFLDVHDANFIQHDHDVHDVLDALGHKRLVRQRQDKRGEL
jgi:hypothetical protein